MTNFEDEKYEVLNKKIIAPGTALLELSGDLRFKPGQFIEVRPEHFGSITLAPCSNPKNHKTFEICVKAVGSTSSELIKLLPGDFLNIRGPYGNHWKCENFFGTNVVIITGGLGLVPLRPLLLELEQKKILLTKVTLIAAFRSPEFILFAEDLKRWQKKFDTKTVVEFSHQKFGGEIGSVVDALQKVKMEPEKTLALMCGPEPMYFHCIDVLRQKKLPEKDLYISLERRMECGIGICQHCSCGSNLVCQDGPIFRYDKIKNELNK